MKHHSDAPMLSDLMQDLLKENEVQRGLLEKLFNHLSSPSKPDDGGRDELRIQTGLLREVVRLLASSNKVPVKVGIIARIKERIKS